MAICNGRGGKCRPRWPIVNCLPTLLDTTTRAAAIVQRGGDEETPVLTKDARTLLLQAVDALGRAVAVDSTYLPARLNLAAAYCYLDEIYQARAIIEGARKLAPDDWDMQNLRALILYRVKEWTPMPGPAL